MEFRPLILLVLVGLCFADPIPASDPAVTDDVDTTIEPIDELLVKAANNSKEFDFFWDKDNGLLITEYDMVFTIDEWEKNNGFGVRRQKRTAGIRPTYSEKRWTNKHIPYEMSPGHFTSYDQNTIRQSVADWQKYTCLTFSESRSAPNRVRMQNAGGCFSMVGMKGGAQALGLAPGCRFKRIIIHELGHAIGLHHEQTRPDRDNYVTVHYNNIQYSTRYNFQKYTWSTIMDMGIPYDYYSIMHYAQNAFTSNGGVTIQPKDPKYSYVIGRQNYLSFADIKSVNVMYNCHEATAGCTLTDAQCPGEGFVGKDCTCWCRGTDGSANPIRKCSSTGGGGFTKSPSKKTTKSVVDPYCVDNTVTCISWAKAGYCYTHAEYMGTECKLSCGKCGVATKQPTIPTTPKPVVDPGCKDNSITCSAWAKSGYCDTHPTYMKTDCKLSCGVCTVATKHTTAPTTPKSVVTKTCIDEHEYCITWAEGNMCETYKSYMNDACPKSCKLCSIGGVTKQTLVTKTPVTCMDQHLSCAEWAKYGFCNNYSYMKTHCKKSCGFPC